MKAGLPEDSVALVEDASHETVTSSCGCAA